MKQNIIKLIPKAVIYCREKPGYYFGHCSNAKHENFYANIGKDTWFYCPICKIKWYQGHGNFSNPDWAKDKLIDLWKSNIKMLESYEDMSSQPIFWNKNEKIEYFGVD